jgi:hypothetical protein
MLMQPFERETGSAPRCARIRLSRPKWHCRCSTRSPSTGSSSASSIGFSLSHPALVEKAQMMAAHESPRTTKLYDRTSDVVSLDEVERVVF